MSHIWRVAQTWPNNPPIRWILFSWVKANWVKLGNLATFASYKRISENPIVFVVRPCFRRWSHSSVLSEMADGPYSCMECALAVRDSSCCLTVFLSLLTFGHILLSHTSPHIFSLLCTEFFQASLSKASFSQNIWYWRPLVRLWEYHFSTSFDLPYSTGHTVV